MDGSADPGMRGTLAGVARFLKGKDSTIRCYLVVRQNLSIDSYTIHSRPFIVPFPSLLEYEGETRVTEYCNMYTRRGEYGWDIGGERVVPLI